MIYHGLGEVIYVGAEAVLIKGSFLGLKAVFKVRIPKPYRDPRLDEVIRSHRTRIEAKTILLASEAGAKVPSLLFVDVDKALIVMEYIEGVLLKELLIKSKGVLNTSLCDVLGKVGRYVGMMHRAGIVHGDLTTSNIIVSNNTPYLIDFGLAKMSRSLEDVGVDIHLFIRSLESVHYSIKDEVLNCFMRGYEGVVGSKFKDDVLAKVREIRLRGRYVEERRLRREELP